MTLADTAPRRRSRSPLIAIVIVVVLLVAGWSVFWFLAASRIETELDGWRDREARSGRVYDCTDRKVGGFPFRLEVLCSGVSVALSSQTAEQAATKTLVTARLAGIHVVTQVYTPGLIIAEFNGPATFTDLGQQPSVTANWSLGQASVVGLPIAPQRASLVFDKPSVDVLNGAVPAPLLRADHLELHARVAEGSAQDNPVIETVLRLSAATLLGIHPVLQTPFNSEVRAKLYGLKDTSPKPWPQRFRDLQAAGGRIEIVQSRFEQGDVLALTAGSLSLNASGRLEGELAMTVAGFDKIVPALGIDRLLDKGVSQSSVDKMAPGVSARDVNAVLGALDRAIPGLGDLARKNANAGIAAGISMLGQKTTLEGRDAIALPLKFTDGAMFLGPLQVAQLPPLF